MPFGGDQTGSLGGSSWIRLVEKDEHVAAEAGEWGWAQSLSHPAPTPGVPPRRPRALKIRHHLGWAGEWRMGGGKEEETLLRRWERGGMGWGPRERFVKKHDPGAGGCADGNVPVEAGGGVLVREKRGDN